MKLQTPQTIFWPQLTDQGAAELCDLIQGLSMLAENHYLVQVMRYHRERSKEPNEAEEYVNLNCTHSRQIPLFADDEPF